MSTIFVPAGTTTDGHRVYELIPTKEHTMATTSRNFRIDDELWAEATSYAETMHTTMSHIVNAAITDYVQRHRLNNPELLHLIKAVMNGRPGTSWNDAVLGIQAAARHHGHGLTDLSEVEEASITGYALGWLDDK